MSQVISLAESRNRGDVQTACDLVPQEHNENGVSTPTPTAQTYTVLEAAFAHFNRDLFNGVLPACLIVLNREAGTLGHFNPHKFVEIGGDARVDEIALNPAHFRVDTPKDVLSTLVHEMAHSWQWHFGKRTRGGYHNEQWAARMRSIGLQPYSINDPDKETGYAVAHRIVDDGLFDRSFKVVEATGQTLRWGDDVPVSTDEKKKPKRMTFVCPDCDQKVMGIPKTRVRCDPCNLVMIARDKGEITDTTDITETAATDAIMVDDTVDVTDTAMVDDTVEGASQ
jgi:hypothetical protein